MNSFAEKIAMASQILPMQMISRIVAKDPDTFNMQIYWNGMWITVGSVNLPQWLSENKSEQPVEDTLATNIVPFNKE